MNLVAIVNFLSLILLCGAAGDEYVIIPNWNIQAKQAIEIRDLIAEHAGGKD